MVHPLRMLKSQHFWLQRQISTFPQQKQHIFKLCDNNTTVYKKCNIFLNLCREQTRRLMHGHDREGHLSLTADLEPGETAVEPGEALVEPGEAPVQWSLEEIQWSMEKLQ